MNYGLLGDLKREITLIEIGYPVFFVMKKTRNNQLYIFYARDLEFNQYLAAKIDNKELINLINGEKTVYSYFENSSELFIVLWSDSDESWQTEPVSFDLVEEDALPEKNAYYEICDSSITEYRDQLQGLVKMSFSDNYLMIASSKTRKRPFSLPHFSSNGYQRCGSSVTKFSSVASVFI